MRKENIFYGGSLEITLIVPLRLSNVDTNNFFDCVYYLNIFLNHVTDLSWDLKLNPPISNLIRFVSFYLKWGIFHSSFNAWNMFLNFLHKWRIQRVRIWILFFLTKQGENVSRFKVDIFGINLKMLIRETCLFRGSAREIM